MSNTILEAKHINKYFHDPIRVQVLSDINFSINKGEFVSLTGKSGCGKSTLLYLPVSYTHLTLPTNREV